MKSLATPILASACALVVGCNSGGSANLRDFKDSSSYAIGMNMGAGVKRAQADVDLPTLIRGLEDVIQDREPRLSPQDADMILRTLTSQLEQAAVERREAEGGKNKAEGETYRAENAAREGVKTTGSGLQYEVLTLGDGRRPTATDRVRVHYRGSFIDGSEFDSSYDSDNPVTFQLNGVIPGWTEALQLMPVGSKYRIVLPPDLGYGEQGAPPNIPSNATLIFEVELLGIEQ